MFPRFGRNTKYARTLTQISNRHKKQFPKKSQPKNYLCKQQGNSIGGDLVEQVKQWYAQRSYQLACALSKPVTITYLSLPDTRSLFVVQTYSQHVRVIQQKPQCYLYERYSHLGKPFPFRQVQDRRAASQIAVLTINRTVFRCQQVFIYRDLAYI